MALLTNFKTKQDQVSDILRERIISGEYKRGTRLKQTDIAEQLGVSPTPVREALKLLEAEGYVVSISHRGVIIPELDFERTREVFELRVLLETRLTRLALTRIDHQRVAELFDLQKLYVKAAKASDERGLRAINYRFHFRLYELAGSPETLQFVRVLWAKFPFFRHSVMQRLPRVVAQHAAFLKHLAEGDHQGAVEAMTDHVSEGLSEISQPSVTSAGDSLSRRHSTDFTE